MIFQLKSQAKHQPARRPLLRPCLILTRTTPAQVAGPDGKAAEKRYNVYRNNVTVSLIEALAATFPATRRITGEDFFRAMARFHIRASPPTSPLLFEYGRDFPGFIERYDYARSMPWLADVARIERAWLDAYHAADVPPLSSQDLAAIPPERLGEIVLVPHPATCIVVSPYPAVSIFAANRSAGPVGPINAIGPETRLGDPVRARCHGSDAAAWQLRFPILPHQRGNVWCGRCGGNCSICGIRSIRQYRWDASGRGFRGDRSGRLRNDSGAQRHQRHTKGTARII